LRSSTDSRTIMLGCTRIRTVSGISCRRRSCRRFTASAPMRSLCTPMVVRGGSIIWQSEESSKPMTDTSWGMRRPLSWMARQQPAAMLSLSAKKAVGSTGSVAR